MILLPNRHLATLNHIQEHLVAVESILVLIHEGGHRVRAVAQVNKIAVEIRPLIARPSHGSNHQYAVRAGWDLFGEDLLKERLFTFVKLALHALDQIVQNVEHREALRDLEELLVTSQLPHDLRIRIVCPRPIKLVRFDATAHIVLQYFIELV